MPIRKYKPTSPGRRHGSVLTYEEVTTSKPEKSLLRPLKKTGGRNNYGRITARLRGGGPKRKYRVNDVKLRRAHVTCRATIGRVGNTDHQNVKLGKAGRKRHLGRRPHVRGTAMNPVDHPMGGGEGRTAGGRHPCSPTAVLAKGGRTRRRNHPTDVFNIRRRRKRT